MAKTKNAVEILDRKMRGDAALRRLVEAERVNADIAQMIYDARTRAGLTQQELARLVGTKQPVIARLEDADYDGHSLKMLQRIATALNRSLRVEMSDKGAGQGRSPTS